MSKHCFATPLRHTGFSLIELLVVVFLLSIMSVAAIGAFQPARQFTLDRAADEVVYALRFAQQEAIRSGKVTVVGFSAPDRTVSVYQYDYAKSPPAVVPVMHVLEKRPFLVKVGGGPSTGTAVDVTALFRFEDASTGHEIAFDPSGMPGKALTATTVVALTEAPYIWRGPWQAAGMSYMKGDQVVHDNIDYIALTNHNSGPDFQSDASRWTKRTSPSQVTVSEAGHHRDISVAPKTGFVRMVQR